MQYNVENLFDPYHEPGKLDEDFTPEGKEHWTLESLDQKLENLGQVIRSVVNPDGSHCPDILVMEEVENPWVAKRLKDGALESCQYKKIIVDKTSPDMRGIRVAIMTRLEQAGTPVSHIVYNGGRTIQETPLQIDGHRMIVFANHWKSRLTRPPDTDGGIAKRALSAKLVRKRLDEILEANSKEDVLVVGDLNDEPEDDSIAKIVGASSSIDDPNALLWEPSSELLKLPRLQDLEETDRDPAFKALRGTFLYRKQYFQLDHILLSKGLFDEEGFSYQPGSYQVIRFPKFIDPRTHGPLTFKNMIDADGNDRGPKGASDHFPIMLRLNY
ncbi:MAG: endonuclease [Bacteriovoracaceae bacterium]|nr:endonuclease [Bacteriovoracaceae bacterium]